MDHIIHAKGTQRSKCWPLTMQCSIRSRPLHWHWTSFTNHYCILVDISCDGNMIFSLYFWDNLKLCKTLSVGIFNGSVSIHKILSLKVTCKQYTYVYILKCKHNVHTYIHRCTHTHSYNECICAAILNDIPFMTLLYSIV